MFKRIENLILSLFTDMQTTFIWIFALGGLFSGLMVAFGGEENAPRFKKYLMFCIIGLVVFLLAKPIVEYIKAKL